MAKLRLQGFFKAEGGRMGGQVVVGVPDRMAGTQTQQLDEPGVFGELRAAEAQHTKGRETREELRRSRP